MKNNGPLVLSKPATVQKANLSNPIHDLSLSELLLQVHWRQSNFADNPVMVANLEGTVQHTPALR